MVSLQKAAYPDAHPLAHPFAHGCALLLHTGVQGVHQRPLMMKNSWIYISSYCLYFDEEQVARLEIDKHTAKYTLSLNEIQDGKISEDWFSFNVNATQDSLTPKIDKTSAYIQIIRESFGLSEEEIQSVKNRFRMLDDFGFFETLSLPQKIRYTLEETSVDSEDEFREMIEKIKTFEYYCILKDILDEALKAEIKNACYIGPFRDNPERVYRSDNNRDFFSVGKNGEDAVKLLIQDSKAAEVASKWLEDILGCKLSILSLGDSGYYQMLIQNIKTGIESNIMDVGYGISQILPIITQLAAVSINHTADSKGNELYIIEQPELHLHPNAQASLADIFASVIKKTVGLNRTMLIETHSEHFIRGLQLLIADTKSPCHIDSDQVKIYYVHGQNEDEKGKHDGSWIEEMKMNEYGQFIKKWPENFFDKAYRMTSSMMSAVNERKRKGGDHH